MKMMMMMTPRKKHKVWPSTRHFYWPNHAIVQKKEFIVFSLSSCELELLHIILEAEDNLTLLDC